MLYLAASSKFWIQPYTVRSLRVLPLLFGDIKNLLKLAGKDPESAFPEGVWQFYAGYALREDTARHTNETHGFDTLLDQHNIQLNAVDRLTAWLMASVICLHQYNSLLENEWKERVSLSLLEESSSARAKRLHRDWQIKLPYRREEDAPDLDYPAYRKYKFEQFLKQNLQSLPAAAYEKWWETLRHLTRRDLGAYQQQMSILAYLDPGPYGETRVPFNLAEAQIGSHISGQLLSFSRLRTRFKSTSGCNDCASAGIRHV